MVAIPIVLFVVFSTIMSAVLVQTFEGWDGDTDELRMLTEGTGYLPGFIGAGIVMVLVMAGIILITNRTLTRRVAKSITAPLDTLAYGVKEIHDGNLSFRLGYLGKDEFSAVCGDFNQMAERLEYLETTRQRDEETRRELIAGISHDLRTPLTAIKAYLEGIEKGVAETPEQRERYFGIIGNKVDDLEHIIEQLFLFSKLDADSFPVNPEITNLEALVQKVLEDMGEDYLLRGLRIVLESFAPDVSAYADPVLLRGVIANILENSARYKTKETGTVSVSLQHMERYAILRITDDGPGVPEDALHKLFDVFYRADPSRSAIGNGLGLAISAKATERMGGRIHAELPPDGGLAIVLRLPRILAATYSAEENTI
jgi:signal transduction histidine kinase